MAFTRTSGPRALALRWLPIIGLGIAAFGLPRAGATAPKPPISAPVSAPTSAPTPAPCAALDTPASAGSPQAATGVPLAAGFAQAVSPRLGPPAEVASAYAAMLQAALDDAGIAVQQPQFVVVVDRHPQIQALLLFWGAGGASWRLVGASPVSTGLPGRFEHFVTPLGVFAHTLGNPDFRAEGTRNALGIRGYGLRGARVYDFGWVSAPKGWGDQAVSVMRLQMHATDPDRLEPRLGTAQSKGCIRISASLNDFIDRHAVLDAEYDEASASDRRLWVLRADREPTPWSGRYLVVVETVADARPPWAVPLVKAR